LDVGGKSRRKCRHLAGGFIVILTASLVSAAAAFAVVPEVRVPDVPDVQVPDVDLPAQPSVPLPSVEPPSIQAIPPTTPSTPAGPGGPAQSSYGGPAGSRVGSAVALAPGASADWSGSVAGGSGTAGSSEQRRAMQRQRRARERVFRRKIRRLAPCFYALSGFESRVLALRAGLDGSRPQSRGYVARRLEVSRRTVHRTESRGLRKLRRTNSSDRCAFASGPRPHGIDVAVRMLIGAPVADDALVFVASGQSRGGDRGEVAVAGTQASSDPDAAGIAVSLTGSGEGEYGSGGVAIWALLAAAALLVSTLILAAQRRRQPPAAAAGPSITEAHARADEESIADVAIPPPPWEQGPKPSGSPDDGRPRSLRSILSRHRR
jgi:hypothetical protein